MLTQNVTYRRRNWEKIDAMLQQEHVKAVLLLLTTAKELKRMAFIYA